MSSSSLNAPVSASGNDSSPDSKGKKGTPKRTVQSNKSDLLGSYIGKNLNFTSKNKGKNSDLGHGNREDEVEENDDNLEVSYSICFMLRGSSLVCHIVFVNFVNILPPYYLCSRSLLYLGTLIRMTLSL